VARRRHGAGGGDLPIKEGRRRLVGATMTERGRALTILRDEDNPFLYLSLISSKIN
jgi:hypothetical protein